VTVDRKEQHDTIPHRTVLYIARQYCTVQFQMVHCNLFVSARFLDVDVDEAMRRVEARHVRTGGAPHAAQGIPQWDA